MFKNILDCFFKKKEKKEKKENKQKNEKRT